MPEFDLILKHRPHAGQQQCIDQSRRFNVLQCGRRFGKTDLGTNRLVTSAAAGRRAAWFAPTYKYLSEVWRETLSLVQPIKKDVSVQEKRIELATRGVIEFWSLDNPDVGRGRKYHDALLDEAGIVRDLEQVWSDAIRPTLTDYKGGAWFFGTPKGRNFFHRLYARGQDEAYADWASWRMPTTANPFIDPAEVEAARREMLPSAFNQEYLGIPADDGGNPFGIDAIGECVGEMSAEAPRYVGIDLAKSEDWTVVVMMDAMGGVCRLERWQSDWGQTKRRIAEMVGRLPCLIDSTGVGDPIVEDLQRAGVKAEAFRFTSNSKQQLMEGLAASIQLREITFPDGWLKAELESFQYEYRPTGVKYSAPEGLHDDGVMGLALCDRNRKQPKITLKRNPLTADLISN